MKKLFWFVVAGGSGFAVDAGVTLLLIAYTPAGPFIARIVAIATAMLFTWLVNRHVTFGKSDRRVLHEGFLYAFVGIVAALINYGIYALLLLRNPDLQPFIALFLSSLSAMVFSYFGYSRFVFRRREKR